MTRFTTSGIIDALEGGAATDDAVLSAVRAATLDWHRTQRGGAGRCGTARTAQVELWHWRAPGSNCMASCASGALARGAGQRLQAMRRPYARGPFRTGRGLVAAFGRVLGRGFTAAGAC